MNTKKPQLLLLRKFIYRLQRDESLSGVSNPVS